MLNSMYNTPNIIDSMNMIYSFGVYESMKDEYVKIALVRLRESCMALRGSLYYLKDFTPEQAQSELKFIEVVMPVLEKIQCEIISMGDDFSELKIIANEFVETIKEVYFGLREIADVNEMYTLSIPVLAEDWEHPDNDHWDNY